MDHETSLQELVRGVQAGDDDAARAAWDRYFPQLVRLAGRKLDGQRRQAADEEDIAISVMESFSRARQGRFPQLNDGDGIWRLLARMTSRKAIDLIRKNAARPLVGESALDGSDPQAAMADQPGRDPAPEMSVLVADEIHRLLTVLPEKYHDVVLKKLECLTVAEIAEQCGVHISTIERRLRIIRSVWETELGRG